MMKSFDRLPDLGLRLRIVAMTPLSLQPLTESLLHVVLSLAIGMSYVAHPARQLCAALTTLWLVLAVFIPAGVSSWRIGLALILLLNLRGVVLSEGPQPVSHMDYILIITAFLAAIRPNGCQYWQKCLAVCCWAIGFGAALSLPKLILAIETQSLPFRLGFLSINQTALLAGIGVCSALSCVLTATGRVTRLISAVPLLLCIMLAIGTHSRAALGFVPVSILLASLLFQTGRPTTHPAPCRSILSKSSFLLAAIVALAAIVLHLYGAPRSDQLRNFYGEENYMNDRGRAAVYSCYAAAPLTGENRFIYGVGYGNSSKGQCNMRQRIGRNLTHAHNLFLQVWAETGLVPGIALLTCAAYVARRLHLDQGSVWRRSKSVFCVEARMRVAYNIIIIYPILFSLVELGMLKVPMLTVLFGHLMGLGLQRVQAVDAAQELLAEVVES